MMFLLKKIVGMATDPFLVGLTLLVLGVLVLAVRRDRLGRGRVLVVLGTAILVLSALWPVASLVTGPLEDDYATAEVGAGRRSVRFVAVLGGGHMQQPGRPEVQWLNAGAADRLVEGIRLFHALEDPHLIVSGWAGKAATPHAAVTAAAAASLGVAPDRIVQLPGPRDTAEELTAIAEVVGEEPFFLVTSASHLPRAMAAARRRNLDALPAPTDFRARVPRGVWAWVPDPQAMAVTTAAIHEYVGQVGYRLLDR